MKNVQLVNVGMKYPVHKADAGAFVWVLVGDFDVDFPIAAGERCYIRSVHLLLAFCGISSTHFLRDP
jgi:hypothetical protein